MSIEGFPRDCRLINLHEDRKDPVSRNGHLDALPSELFVATGQNVGLVLGIEPISWLIALDIDYLNDPAAQAILRQADETAPTMAQDTPHGVQRIWVSPVGLPCLRSDLRGQNGVFGQLLSHGYVVGPGSRVRCTGKKHPDGASCGVGEYKRTNDLEPQPAPEWIVRLAVELGKREKAATGETRERNAVPKGSHDKFMADVAYNLRRYSGLDQGAIERFFRSGGLAGATSCLEGYNPADPFTVEHIERWAKSAVRAVPTPTPRAEMPDIVAAQDLPTQNGFLNGSDMRLIGNPFRWWIRGFVPHGRFVALYGKGGTGKSTFGSYLGALVTQKGSPFLAVCVEESRELFTVRAVLGGADRSLLYGGVEARQWRFPRDFDALRQAIIATNARCVWIDSLYSHIEHLEGTNAAERARIALGPIAGLAEELDCTIVGVIHENKAGQFLGSVEVEDVARIMLLAERSRRHRDAPLKIKVSKTNMPYEPDYYMQFRGEPTIVRDPETGEIQLEEVEPGKCEPLLVRIAQRGDDVRLEDEPGNDHADVVAQGAAARGLNLHP